jgi:hypothetical protein
MPTLPGPRGPITEALFAALRRPPHALQLLPALDPPRPEADDDLQLALYCSYELHYRGFSDVDECWEWAPAMLAARAALEAPFEARLAELAPPQPYERDAAEMDLALREVAAGDDGPSVARFVESRAREEHLLEFLVHRSGYQLKEADPHSWAIPRLSGAPKAALVEVQADEYGGGNPERMHAQLFADSMRALGLDATYGAYLDHLPAPTLATVNLMSLFGLHRRLRGAIVGHLALFEMTSSAPNRRYARGLRRLGFDVPEATRFFDEHVEADAVHENVAAVDLAGGLARQEPALAGQIVWGARALVALERRWAEHVLGAWEEDRCSLRYPVAPQEPGRERPSAALGALKPDSLCVPSQNGRSLDLPHRQSAIVDRATSISRPS